MWSELLSLSPGARLATPIPRSVAWNLSGHKTHLGHSDLYIPTSLCLESTPNLLEHVRVWPEHEYFFRTSYHMIIHVSQHWAQGWVHSQLACPPYTPTIFTGHLVSPCWSSIGRQNNAPSQKIAASQFLETEYVRSRGKGELKCKWR